ncbi:dihydrolipoyllysine-residue acetyltransferase [Telmatocola sphagniphila]|uniref:Dihydrolipoamide acetyltransferase component of pyruvate dehydrogenase complex n=1 Tax=Telmatocola sphagniphila TaxID=1123043 RepID=A0A8E6BCZ9_9BACT|nr:dihydrolipoyllysine-residue acetyltransferase [Telmatocola sphagniphila]QVL34640.1 dihydrolipoyllysine-residue acetyltransferase [Telmatocola sphagniphila]
MDFRLPELGEGIASATITSISVKAGDLVTPGQTLLEVETDKASMPIPAPIEGKIDSILVKKGDQVKVGSVILNLSGGTAAASNPAPAPAAPTPTAETKPSPTPVPAPAASTVASSRVELKLPILGEGIEGGTITTVSVKVGDTVEKDQVLFEIETDKASMPIPSTTAGKVEEIKVARGQQAKIGSVLAVISGSAPAGSAASTPANGTPAAPAKSASPPVAPAQIIEAPAPVNRVKSALVPAGPATRRLARELGIDLSDVPGSARGGRVTLDDIKAYTRKRIQGVPSTSVPAAGAGTIIPPLPDFSKYGPVEKKPFTTLRKAIARNLTLSWNVAPQVTQHDLADITELEAGRKRFVESTPKGSAKVTMTTLVVKACVAALKAFPHFNSSYDPHAGDNGEMVVKKYYHIGIAVDTPRGLVVPVIRDADKKTMLDLAREIQDLAEKARDGKLSPDEMRGGTFTITNLGGIGGTYFSPILNYPEVAILGLSRSTLQPVVREGKIEPRLMLPLSLTYDHRVIDGADGARFTSRIASMLADPSRLMFES